MSASVDIQLRGGKHQVRWREVSGRRRARTFTRERDATRFAAQVRTTLEAGGVLHLDQEIPTLAAFMEEYWRVYALPNLSPNTRDVYKPVWGEHARPRLGHMTLRAINAGRGEPAACRADAPIGRGRARDPRDADDAAERHGARGPPSRRRRAHEPRARRAQALAGTPRRTADLADRRRAHPRATAAPRRDDDQRSGVRGLEAGGNARAALGRRAPTAPRRRARSRAGSCAATSCTSATIGS